MSNIINGTLPQIINKTNHYMVVDSTGKEITTGIQIVSGNLAQIKSQVSVILVVDENGNSLFN